MSRIKLIQIGIIIAAAAAILATVYMRGRHDVQALCDAERSATAVVVAKIMASNKAREAQLQEIASTERDKMLRGFQDVESRLNGTIADLRSGNRKLRPQYTCPNPVPGAATDPARVAGADVSDPVGKLLERCSGAIAAGDKAIIQRNTAIEILKEERRP